LAVNYRKKTSSHTIRGKQLARESQVNGALGYGGNNNIGWNNNAAAQQQPVPTNSACQWQSLTKS